MGQIYLTILLNIENFLVKVKYNKKENKEQWIKRIDFNKDGIADIFDIVYCSKKCSLAFSIFGKVFL